MSAPLTTTSPRSTDHFRYLDWELADDCTELACHYEVAGRRFTEHFVLEIPEAARVEATSVSVATSAARLVHLLAGVSYYKTAAPPVIDLATGSETERDFLRHFYLEGLGEFAYRNHLDLSDLEVRTSGPLGPVGPAPSFERGGIHHPLVPFGGGIDSIVTVEALRQHAPDTALFVVAPRGLRFAAIEAPAAITGLPVIRVERHLDPQVLRSEALGFLNGHVPVTGIYSAVAVWAAACAGRDAVVMSNEWSASLGNVHQGGRAINHQYSKSRDFEERFRDLLATAVGGSVDYFSYLRGRSELWVAERFAHLPRYQRAFRSCNRAFHVDPEARLAGWCGRCDKCCFIDLVLAPFMARETLAAIFDGHEPLENPGLSERFRTLIGTSTSPKPWECVGEPGECRAAAVLAARRADRVDADLLTRLAAEAEPLLEAEPLAYLDPMDRDHVPDELAAQDLLG